MVEDKAGNQSATLRVKIVAGENGNKPTLTGIDNMEILKGSLLIRWMELWLLMVMVIILLQK